MAKRLADPLEGKVEEWEHVNILEGESGIKYLVRAKPGPVSEALKRLEERPGWVEAPTIGRTMLITQELVTMFGENGLGPSQIELGCWFPGDDRYTMIT